MDLVRPRTRLIVAHVVRLTREFIKNLKAVQQQETHSGRLVARGRLAAIFGYSQLPTGTSPFRRKIRPKPN